MRVLLVEDDDLIGSGVEAGLRQAGFTVDGGAAALPRCEQGISVLIE